MREYTQLLRLVSLGHAPLHKRFVPERATMACLGLCGTAEPDTPLREGVINGPQTEPTFEVAEPNAIRTSKYTWYNFIGKSLLEQ